jgi:ATP-dependent helicase/nuclease subunit A
MATNWTKDQETAINEYGENIIVSAGAGSGKTAVLSERVLTFVKDKGYSLDNFLLLTFTKLAAGEMKDRIRKKLSEHEETKLEASKVDTSDITTFDGYASSLVKKYHFLLNVSPNVINIDKSIMSVKKRNIIDEIFKERYIANDKNFLYLIDKYCLKKDDDIKDLVLKIHDYASLQLNTNEFLDNFVNERYEDKFIEKTTMKKIYETLLPLKEDLVDSFYSLPEEQLNKKDKGTCQEVVLNSAQDFIASVNYDSLIEGYSKIEYPKRNNKIDVDYTTFDYSKKCRDKLKETLDKIPTTSKEIIEIIKENKSEAEALISLVKELDKRQYAYKVEKQAFEFNDIAKMALNLIQTNEDVRNALKNKYKMILIDEYQDTSEIQEKLISLISNNNVYMVGDIKQSIYAFRNARSDIFKAKYLKYKNHDDGKAIDMNKNFRSRKEVLDDINDIFSNIMTLDYGDADYKNDHIIQFGNTSYEEEQNKDASINYHSTFITYDSSLLARQSRDLEIRIIAEDIINKINNKFQVFIPGKGAKPHEATFSDFCILIDKGTTFDAFKKIFNEYQIPLYVEENENIKDNIIVSLLRSLLIVINTIMTDSYDSDDFKVAFISLARSFLYEYSDEKIYQITSTDSYKKDYIITSLKKIIDENNQLPTHLLIEKVINSLDFYVKLIKIGNVEKNELYLDKFLSYFKDMSLLDYSLSDFITYLDNLDKYDLKIELPSTSTSINSVKIMNIHKSKGLEFPIIYFPMLNTDFLQKASAKEYDICSYGIIMPHKNEIRNKEVHPLKYLSSKLKKIDALSERIRLFYVAVTRAKEKMIFIVKEQGDKELLDTFDVKNAKTFRQFIYPLISKYEHYSYSKPENKVALNEKPCKIEKKKFSFTPITFSQEQTTLKHASKQLVINTNTELLDLGTKLHEVMEILDFKNPDYSFIKDPFMEECAKAFLSSDLTKDIKNAKIYKEYEFIDNDVHGIIDLLLIYDDHVDIIDYKTKHIDDKNYDKQLEVYRTFIASKIKNKQIHTYLYSLIDKSSRETK